MYDTTSRETFDKLDEWLNEVEMYSTKKDLVKMLVGNKIDKVSNSLTNCPKERLCRKLCNLLEENCNLAHKKKQKKTRLSNAFMFDQKGLIK